MRSRFSLARILISPCAVLLLALITLSSASQAFADELPDFQPRFADPFAEAPASVDLLDAEQALAHIDPQGIVPSALKTEAVKYWTAHAKEFPNRSVLSIVDFSKNSAEPRFYIIHMGTGAVWSIHVAHGKGSDPNSTGYARSFSNAFGSNKSSLGYYRASEVYVGEHGRSIRLDGLSATNSNARDRAIVIHSAVYVSSQNRKAGRSDGCLAVSLNDHDQVIKLLQGGSLIYASRSAD